MNSKLEVYDSTGALKLQMNYTSHTHPVADNQDHGSFTVATGQYHVHGKNLIISGANSVIVEGTGRIVIL